MHHILLIGLNPRAPPPGAPVSPAALASIAEKITLDIARAARHGYIITPHYLDWQDPASAFRSLEKALVSGPSPSKQAEDGQEKDKEGEDKEGEKKWEAVIFGQGLRMWKDVELFEGAMGVVRRVCDNGTKVMFNDGADRQCAAVERGFGIVVGE